MPHDPLTYLVPRESLSLRAPVLIAAFKGWNDAGEGATFAARHLIRAWNAQKIAMIDPEEFYDFQAVRPEVKLVDGITREIEWPENSFWAATMPGGRDALILTGIEPSHRWRAFTTVVVELASELGVELVITLGALLADVPHSRSVPITGTAGDDELVERLGLQRSRYEGPTGIVGILNDAFRRAGVDAASLWAAVPHYLAVSPNPKAALALVEKTVGLTGISVDIGDLQHAASGYEERVSEIVAADDDVQNYVHLLEERLDEEIGDEDRMEMHEIPSADEIADELEKFLRDHGS
jgi:proteasome assembly chaperone (PAC2) family protein